MKHWKRWSSLLLCVLMVCVLAAGCSAKPETQEQTESPAEPEPIHVAALNGPTGIGMVKVMSDAEAGENDPAYQADFILPHDGVRALFQILCNPFHFFISFFSV